MKETKKATAEKTAKIFGKRRPKQRSYGLGELKSHLDKGEDFITYAVAREEENAISHVARRVSVSINGSCEEWAKEKAKKNEPAPNGPNDDRPPMGIREFCDLQDKGKAFLIIKDSDGDYVVHEIAEGPGGFTLAEPANEWLVIALGEYVDEHPDEGRERWWLEGEEDE